MISSNQAMRATGAKKVQATFLLWVDVLVAMSFMFGCGYRDKTQSHFQTIPGSADDFRPRVIELGLFGLGEHIRRIRVFDLEDVPLGHSLGQVYWEVVAAPPVRAHGFELVAGQVPEGFRQVVPPPSETFKPVPGRWYFVAVTMSDPSSLARPDEGTLWIAE
jgi:hypothetical protein